MVVRYVGTVQYASIFAKKYSTLIQHAFFVMVWARYVGTLFEVAYAKRFVGNVRPSMNIRTTVPGVHIVKARGSQTFCVMVLSKTT